MTVTDSGILELKGGVAVRTGYARTDDGQQLYWRVVGTGPPLACCNGVGVSTFFWKYITEHFRTRFSVLLWDYRGHGLSSMPSNPKTADLGVERCADDLATVLAAAGFANEPAVLLGHSMGCQVILEFSKRHAASVRGLVPMFGTFARPLDTFMDNPNSRQIFEIIRRVAALGGRSSRRLLRPLYASPLAFDVGRRTGLVDRFYAQRQDIDLYLEHLCQMNPLVFLRMVELLADHDLTDHLPTIDAPTLVIAGERDLFTPLHRSEAMAELIPGAEILVLAEGSHAAIVEHPDTINQRIERFIDEHDLGSSPTG